MANTALGIIDAQRGFMPIEEGQRLDLAGFGELPVARGQEIVAKLNTLLGEFATRDFVTFTTQDYHPQGTAHFDVDPNYTTTWPVHCVGGTAGAELHPEINILPDTRAFYKGAEILENGADDTSYSGYNALAFEDDKTLPEFLAEREVTKVILGGLALDYCVRATALDLRTKAGMDVTVVIDATAPVAEETGIATVKELEQAGVKFMTTNEVVWRMK